MENRIKFLAIAVVAIAGGIFAGPFGALGLGLLATIALSLAGKGGRDNGNS